MTKSKTYGELPTPTRLNYHFTGWYTKRTGGVKVTSATKVTLTAKQTLYAHWSKTAVKAKTTKSGSWTVTVPEKYVVRLYADKTTASSKAMLSESPTGWTLKCTKKATLSNGTTRYYTKVDNKNYWFTYSNEMTAK